MLKIYVCEDNQKQLDRMVAAIEAVIQEEQLDMKVEMVADHPRQILDQMEQSNEPGIYFLDIDLGAEINGLDLAVEIRAHQPRAFIIFVTTHSEMSHMTFYYKVEAMDFIVKEECTDLKQRVGQCLAHVGQLNQSVEEEHLVHHFRVKSGCKLWQIPYEDIFYFEVSPHVSRKVTLYGRNQIIEFCGNLKEVKKTLDERFYRCHRMYLVNLDYIQEIDWDAKEIVLRDETTIPFSARIRRALREKCNNSLCL